MGFGATHVRVVGGHRDVLVVLGQLDRRLKAIALGLCNLVHLVAVRARHRKHVPRRNLGGAVPADAVTVLSASARTTVKLCAAFGVPAHLERWPRYDEMTLLPTPKVKSPMMLPFACRQTHRASRPSRWPPSRRTEPVVGSQQWWPVARQHALTSMPPWLQDVAASLGTYSIALLAVSLSMSPSRIRPRAVSSITSEPAPLSAGMSEEPTGGHAFVYAPTGRR